MLGCDQAPSQVCCLTGGTVPVATVVVLGWLSPALLQSHSHALGWSPRATKASLSLGQTAGVRGMVGLAVGVAGSCQEPVPPPSWGGYWRIPSTWQGGVGGGARAYILASSSAAGSGSPGSGSINSPIFPEAYLPPQARQALPPARGAGVPPRPAAPQARARPWDQAARLSSPPPTPPRAVKFPEAHIWKGFSGSE